MEYINSVYDTIKAIPYGQFLNMKAKKLVKLERLILEELYLLSQEKLEKTKEYQQAVLALNWVKNIQRIQKAHKATKEVILVGRIIKGGFNG